MRTRRFPAYQANIVAYVVSVLAWKTNGAIDFGSLWSRQAISPELGTLIGNWADQIDRVLRFTAENRMPSEWAKKQECWNKIRETEELEIGAAPPREFKTPAAASISAELGIPQSNGGAESDVNRDELICNIRQMFSGAEVRSRDDVIARLQASTDNERLDDQIREELNNAIRTAVRRGILEHRGDGLALSARNITDYQREFLKDQYLASMQARGWVDREESIRRFARWLGFRRTGPTINEASRSIINGLIRESRLESNGQMLRRT